MALIKRFTLNMIRIIKKNDSPSKPYVTKQAWIATYSLKLLRFKIYEAALYRMVQLLVIFLKSCMVK